MPTVGELLIRLLGAALGFLAGFWFRSLLGPEPEPEPEPHE